MTPERLHRVAWPCVTLLVAAMSFGLGVLASAPDEAPRPARRPAVATSSARPPAATRSAPLAEARTSVTSGPSGAAPANEARAVGTAPQAPAPPPATPFGSWPHWDPSLANNPSNEQPDALQARLVLSLAQALQVQYQPRAAWPWARCALELDPTLTTISTCMQIDPEATLSWLEVHVLRMQLDPASALTIHGLLPWSGNPGARRRIVDRLLLYQPTDEALLNHLLQLDPAAALARMDLFQYGTTELRLQALRQLGRHDEALRVMRAAYQGGQEEWLTRICQLAPEEGAELMRARPDSLVDWTTLQAELELADNAGETEVSAAILRVVRGSNDVSLLTRLAEWCGSWFDSLDEGAERTLGQTTCRELLDRLEALGAFEGNDWLSEVPLSTLDPERYVRFVMAMQDDVRVEAVEVLLALPDDRVSFWIPRLPADHGVWCAALDKIDLEARPALVVQLRARALVLFPEDAKIADLLRRE